MSRDQDTLLDDSYGGEWPDATRSHAPNERGGRGMRILLIAVAALLLLALGAGGFALLSQRGDDEAQPSASSSNDSADTVGEIRQLVQDVGYDDVTVEQRDGTIFLSGTLEQQSDIAAVVAGAMSLANDVPINTDGLTLASTETTVAGTDDEAEPDAEAVAAPTASADPLQRLQVVLDRTVAATPIIFEPGASDLASWQTSTVDQVADILLANPGIAVTVVGYTDDSGPAELNRELSLDRASAVQDYLVERGIEPGLVEIDARGEAEATGLRDVSYLERRVEFEVVAASNVPLEARPLDIGVIVPSPSDDLAFSQSLIDALNVLDVERGGLTLTVAENMFDVDEANLRAEEYAEGGADVVILHGSQYRPLVEALAEAWPDVVFVVGPSVIDSELPNIFAYTIAAEQGAYVMGDLAGSLSETGTIGIVGPIPVPEPQLFVEGFRLGAESQGAEVLVEYVGSFNDVEAATGVAQSHVAGGADVLTGTAQLTVGPVGVVEDEGLLWFANQANQTSLAPERVVASQVYHVEVAIREILAEIDANSITGGTFPLTLGNGGMLLEFNPDYPLGRELRQRADDLLFEVTAGSVTVDVELDE